MNEIQSGGFYTQMLLLNMTEIVLNLKSNMTFHAYLLEGEGEGVGGGKTTLECFLDEGWVEEKNKNICS